MQKDELIQMHTLLCQLKNLVQETRPAGPERVGVAFQEYERLGVSPLHVHRSKTDHKRAIFVLGKELARVMSSGEFSNPELVSHRFGTLAMKMERPKAQ